MSIEGRHLQFTRSSFESRSYRGGAQCVWQRESPNPSVLLNLTFTFGLEKGFVGNADLRAASSYALRTMALLSPL